jgi:hypothetical protein
LESYKFLLTLDNIGFAQNSHFRGINRENGLYAVYYREKEEWTIKKNGADIYPPADIGPVRASMHRKDRRGGDRVIIYNP